ncbi:type VI secretion system-associated FHA domain protein TagH [Shewanella sp. OMA3-2]|uniref:type VI secretion system-associated FHA domain protein TagH n=1 Tax=Shewanella sp. OMA3-2 TaxID=2908650 RepID=UPI001F361B13|nr:type VI secretion system-associated FHA domain protein TagH [Shewanella sp. OMA3-2]UJF20479.1 type VI secretion system-associated FHA domain protein TagH [Shewanella sp. OMA3-2]
MDDVKEMELTLEIVSYHRLSPEQITIKNVTQSLTMGRAETCDWYLPDPEKVVSGTHARISKREDGFYIEDLSTNGLYVNRAVDALGTKALHRIDHQDLFTFGDYEVSASLVSNDRVSSQPLINTDINQASNFAVSSDNSQSNSNITQKQQSPIFSEHLDNGVAGFDAHTLLNQSSQKKSLFSGINADLQDHFQPPGASIPEEWDKDFFGASDSHVTDTPERQTQPQPQQVKESAYAAVSDVSPTQSSQSHTTQPSQQVTSLTQAFFKGLGVDEQDYAKVLNEALMLELGQSMHLMLTGLMDSLRQRSQLKMEFRINHTTFQQRENNPLKFSANIEDVFQNLFLRKSASFLSSQQAIVEAFNDARKHDIALTSGTIGALQGLLNQLAPELIEQKSQSQSFADMLPGQKQSRQWKVYKSLHQDLKNEFMQDKPAALSDDFVKAYDSKLKLL